MPEETADKGLIGTNVFERREVQRWRFWGREAFLKENASLPQCLSILSKVKNASLPVRKKRILLQKLPSPFWGRFLYRKPCLAKADTAPMLVASTMPPPVSMLNPVKPYFLLNTVCTTPK